MSECFLKETCAKFRNGNCPFPSFCIKNFKVNKFYDLAEIPERYRCRTLLIPEKEDEQAFSRLSSISKNIQDFVGFGNNLYIYSQITGNGKTAWAINLAKRYIDSIWHSSSLDTICLFVNVPKYMFSIKDSISHKNDFAEHVVDSIMSTKLVVWDDIATKTMSEFERENLLLILDHRINSNLSNIFTSNADPSDLYAILGKRLSSRILGCSEKIQFTGKDKRVYDSTSGT